METERYTQTLNVQQFEQALAILHREQQANTPTPLQKKIFSLLSALIYGFTVVIGSSLLSILIVALVPLFTEKEFSPVDVMILRNDALVFFSGLATIYGCLSSVGVLVLFFFNLSYLRELHRQQKLMNSLGLNDAIALHWKRRRRKKRLQEYLFLCGSVLGQISMLLAFGTGIVLLLVAEFLSEYFIGGSLLLILSTFSMVAIVVTNLARRNKVRLELISSLHASLEEQLSQQGKDDESGISISAEDYQKIAQIERAQISRGRIQSILADSDEPEFTSYVLQKSRAAQDLLGHLDPATSLRVQEQIDALMTEPHPPGVVEDTQAGTLKLRVAQSPVTIGYTVDDDKRRIRILSLEITPEEHA